MIELARMQYIYDFLNNFPLLFSLSTVSTLAATTMLHLAIASTLCLALGLVASKGGSRQGSMRLMWERKEEEGRERKKNMVL